MQQVPIFLDFETEGIMPRPLYPPKPVGLAVYDPAGQFDSGYYGFGHSEGNSCTEDVARDVMATIYASRRPVCFHNAMFDLDVAETHWDLPIPDTELVHDTLILAFLFDPHVPSLSLKDLVVHWQLDTTQERDELREWIITHVPEAKRKSQHGVRTFAVPPVDWSAAMPRPTYGLLTTFGLF